MIRYHPKSYNQQDQLEYRIEKGMVFKYFESKAHKATQYCTLSHKKSTPSDLSSKTLLFLSNQIAQ